jgi:hypothetical protein
LGRTWTGAVVAYIKLLPPLLHGRTDRSHKNLLGKILCNLIFEPGTFEYKAGRVTTSS